MEVNKMGALTASGKSICPTFRAYPSEGALEKVYFSHHWKTMYPILEADPSVEVK
jgi:hypothetical protein